MNMTKDFECYKGDYFLYIHNFECTREVEYLFLEIDHKSMCITSDTDIKYFILYKKEGTK